MKKHVLLYSLLLGFFVSNAQWVTQSTNFAATSTGVRDISIVDENTVWIAGYNGTSPTTAFAGFSKTTNGGVTWTAGTVNNIPSGYTFSNILAVNATTAYACMYDAIASKGGGIYKTVDGGTNWLQQGAGVIYDNNSFPNFVHLWNVDKGVTMGDPNGGYFEIYTTMDGGSEWTRVPQANIPAPLASEYGYVQVYDVLGDTVWFGTNKGRIYRSIDAGLNWEAFTTGYSDINGRVAFKNAMEGMISTTVNNVTSIATTTNGGSTWTSVSHTGTLFTNDLRVIRDAGVYVSSGAGVSYSNNNGVNWSTLDSGMQRMQQAWLNANTGWIGGFTNASGGGIFKYQANFPMSANNNIGLSNQINIFPNPATENVTVQVPNYLGKININIIDGLGRLVLNQTSFTETNTIDVNNLKNGLYFVNIDLNGQTICKKIVIQ